MHMRYRDKVGFADRRETAPGVFSDAVIERTYSGDVVKYSSHYKEGQQVNPEIKLRNQISVVGDAYMRDNHAYIRYAWFLGFRYCVVSIEFAGNRLILDLEGLYTDPVEETEEYSETEPEEAYENYGDYKYGSD